MESLLSVPEAKRRVLPPAIRRKIVDLKAEHPPLNLEEIADICGEHFGRRPDGHTVKSVLEESAIPRKLVRRFPPYHDAEDVREGREAVVPSTAKAGRTRASRATSEWTARPSGG